MSVCLATTVVVISPGTNITRRTSRSALRMPHGFAVLTTSAAAGTRLPQSLRAYLDGQRQVAFSKSDLGAARRVVADKPYWLVPAETGVLCLTGLIYPSASRATGGPGLPPLPAVTCTPDKNAEAGRLITYQLLTTANGTYRSTRVVGVVPNGVATVTIDRRHAPPISLPVVRNGYETMITHPVRLQFVAREGARARHHNVDLAGASGGKGNPPRRAG